MAVSKRLRFEVLRRDNHACRYCGATAPDVAITIDHVMPVALGGADVAENLVACCVDCNAGKSSVPATAPLVADVALDAMRWAKAMQMAAETERAKWSQKEDLYAAFAAEWEQYLDLKWVGDGGSFTSTVDQLTAAGLSMEDLTYAIRVAVGKDLPNARVWKYFCGVSWRIVSNRVEAAKAIAESLEADEEPT